ncbi:hypothetical protein [Arthrobacter crystallopoietes]|uniref:hypothetical protein n=1 Tax=Crystallibacter crystallopoietes TaxID=37928 RepID=UPI0011112D25|nr:hypothetical protein [Arthrobacter crystallopoietes]QTG80467.1 hypothetical protein J5251_16765 [Arthrobacter crystallopoietes]
MGQDRFRDRLPWVVIALLVLPTAAAGLLEPAIYDGLVEPAYIPGAYSQDAVSVVAAAGLLWLAVVARADRPKLMIVALGVLGYFFYAYGIYTIERVYNSLYLLYMAVFALSFWGAVYGAIGLVRRWPRASLPRGVRLTSASGAMLQPLLFYPLWIAMLLPLMSSREQIQSVYSVFILDLCFIMPAFLLLSLGVFRGRTPGLVLLPSAYVLGFTLIFSLAAAELAKGRFGAAFEPVPFWQSLLLSGLFLVLGLMHLTRLVIGTRNADRQGSGQDCRKLRPQGQKDS